MKASLVVTLVATLVVAALTSGCVLTGNRVTIDGSGIAATETRELTVFTRIAIEGSGDAVVLFGQEPSIIVQADDNLLEYILTDVEDGTLKLRLRHPDKHASFRNRTAIRYTITTPSVEALGIAGSGSVNCTGLHAAEFDIDIAGSGTITLDDMTCGTVTIDIAGSGDVRMSGVADRQSIDIAGSGNISAGDLKTERTRIEIAGSGDATVWATERLNVSIAGGGDVRYYGSPSLSKSVDGMGSVRHLGDKGTGSRDA